MKSIISHSVEETFQIARDFSKGLQGGEVIALQGNLGAGKTHFVKGLAQGLGVESVVRSPTFILHQRHSCTVDFAQGKTLNHLDLYRLDENIDSLGFGFDELISPDQITVVEWAEKIPEVDEFVTYEIRIDHLGDNERRIVIYIK